MSMSMSATESFVVKYKEGVWMYNIWMFASLYVKKCVRIHSIYTSVSVRWRRKQVCPWCFRNKSAYFKIQLCPSQWCMWKFHPHINFISQFAHSEKKTRFFADSFSSTPQFCLVNLALVCCFFLTRFPGSLLPFTVFYSIYLLQLITKHKNSCELVILLWSNGQYAECIFPHHFDTALASDKNRTFTHFTIHWPDL